MARGRWAIVSVAWASAGLLAASGFVANAQTAPAIVAPEPAAVGVPSGPAASPVPVEVTPSVPAAAAEPQAVPAGPNAGEAASVTASATPSASSAVVPDACFASPAKLDPSRVDAFLANPASLLTQYDGGMRLSNEVRALAGSDKRTLAPLISLSAAAKPEQKAMIGAGLGRAAFACSRVSPVYAALIQSLMASSNSPELLTAFLSASNDVQTAALGAAGGGGGAAAAGLSGGGVAGPGSAGLDGDDVVPTTVETYNFASRNGILLGGGITFRSDNSVSPSSNN